MTQWGLDTLFNPAKRYMDEEKRRLQSTREEIGDNSGGKRIDLEAGKVTIQKPAADDADEGTAAGNKKAAAKGALGEKKRHQAAADKPAPSPAAVRAAERRGRKPR